MKKLKATVTQKDGSKKEIYVIVDDGTAKTLEQVEDKDFVNQYLIDEYEIFMADYHERLRTQSLDKSLDNGFELEDENQDLFENLMQEIDRETVNEAINKLEPQQQWIVEQIFFEQRKKKDIAAELGVSSAAITSRLEKILRKLKKFLQ